MTKVLQTPRKIMTKFICLSIISGIASGILQLVTPLYAISIHASDAEIGLTRGIFSIRRANIFSTRRIFLSEWNPQFGSKILVNTVQTIKNIELIAALIDINEGKEKITA